MEKSMEERERSFEEGCLVERAIDDVRFAPPPHAPTNRRALGARTSQHYFPR